VKSRAAQNGLVTSWRGHNDTAMLAEAFHGVSAAG
jgi:hypothetical protein